MFCKPGVQNKAVKISTSGNLLSMGIREMFNAKNALNRAFPKKPFTPDGRMVGDIGEAIAEIYYQTTIDSKIRSNWDGVCENNSCNYRDVQIKTTQKDETYLKKPPHEGHLIVFKINPDGKWKCYYNGLISDVWNKMGGSGKERFIKLDKLSEIKERSRISKRNT